MLEYCGDPINQTIDHTCAHPIHDHRPGDGEDLCSNAQDESLGLEFYRRGSDGVGEAGDGDEGAGAGMFGDVIVETQAGEEGAEEHKGNGNGESRER